MVTVTELNRNPDGTFEALETTDTINNADVSTASEGQALLKGASGTDLTFGSANVPSWEEDPNSPLTISSSASGTITLANTYDVVKMIITSTGGQADLVALRINGDTGTNYDYRTLDSKTTDASEWTDAILAESAEGQEINISGRWAGNASFDSLGRNEFDVGAVRGVNDNVTSPLNSITIVEIGGKNIDLEAKVYGLTQ